MTVRVHLQICIKICLTLDHSSTEIIQMIMKTSINEVQIKLWCRFFKDSWKFVESDLTSVGCNLQKLMTDNARIQKMIWEFKKKDCFTEIYDSKMYSARKDIGRNFTLQLVSICFKMITMIRIPIEMNIGSLAVTLKPIPSLFNGRCWVLYSEEDIATC